MFYAAMQMSLSRPDSHQSETMISWDILTKVRKSNLTILDRLDSLENGFQPSNDSKVLGTSLFFIPKLKMLTMSRLSPQKRHICVSQHNTWEHCLTIPRRSKKFSNFVESGSERGVLLTMSIGRNAPPDPQLASVQLITRALQDGMYE